MKDRTTIQIPRELQEELRALKRYKRETYEDIIRRMMKKKDAKKKIKSMVKANTVDVK